MKTKIFITSLTLLLIAALTTCKKQPEAPTGGNKIEIGQTTADSVTYFAAKVSTEIASTGGNEITQHGHCWSTKSNPTTDDAKTNLGKLDSAKIFISEITGLEPNTIYYLRSYVTYLYGTVYGTEKSIKTLETGKPQVSTAEVTSITRTSAKSGGTNDDGGLTLSARGVCWNTTGNPTLENSTGHTNDGSGTGSFTSKLTALTESTHYYVVAYTTNENGTGYGEVKTFKTHLYNTPVITTNDVTEITSTSAKCGGKVSGDNIGNITARGVCWNTTGNPTLENNEGLTTDGNGTGSFTSSITGLTGNTNYYVTAYATNEEETAYGQVKDFVAQDPPCGQLTIDYHGQTYHTVKIGEQCWMKENLNYETGNSWCFVNNPANCNIYGRLYDWATIMNGASSSNEVPSGVQGICPDGWHIPSDAEWKILEGNVDTQYGVEGSEWDKIGWRGYDAGMRLKSTSSWYSGGNGTDVFGFTALSGGYRYTNGYFEHSGVYGYWWSSTEYSSSNAWYRGLGYNNDGVDRSYDDKEYGFSVRCVRD